MMQPLVEEADDDEDALPSVLRLLERLRSGEASVLPAVVLAHTSSALAAVPLKEESLKLPDLELHQHQQRLLTTCLERDSICVMGTGTGKTLVAVRVCNTLLRDLPESFKAIVVCPTVLLLQQQVRQPLLCVCAVGHRSCAYTMLLLLRRCILKRTARFQLKFSVVMSRTSRAGGGNSGKRAQRSLSCFSSRLPSC